MIEMIRQGLQADGITVSISKLCRWFQVPRRTIYYRSVRSEPKVQTRFAEPIKAMIEESPSFGYMTVAHLLGFNKNTVQRIFQLMGWQVRKRPIGFRPRVQALPSVATAPNERWSTDMCRVWAGAGDRLPHAGVAGLASIAQRPRQHGVERVGACADRPVRHARTRA
jgi:putative transposase